MEERRVKYPCTGCKRSQSCSYKDCLKYLTWFSQEWADIRKVADKVKEKKNNRG